MSETTLVKKKRQSGFSLVEMVIAITVFLIVIGAVYGLLRVGTLDRNRASRRSDTLKNARTALQLIGRDTLNAGLSYSDTGALVPDDFLSNQLGFAADNDNERDLLTSVIPGNNVNTNSLQAGRTDMVAFVMRDIDFNGGEHFDIITENSGGAARVMLEARNQSDVEAAAVNELYFIHNDSVRVAAMLTEKNAQAKAFYFNIGDPLGINQSRTETDPNKVSLLRKCEPAVTTNCMQYPSVIMKKILLVTYKVQSDGTLVRTTYGNNTTPGATAAEQIQATPLAYGVRDLQITYVMRNGTLTENPSFVSANNYVPFNRNSIRQLNIRMTVQDDSVDEATGQTNTITLSGSFSTRNLEYN